jgi:hypothetical protein
MKNTTFKQLLFVLFTFLFVSSAIAQIDTPQKRLNRINFLHGKIFEIDNDSKYVENPTFFKIKEGRDSIAQNYPIHTNLKQSEFSSEAHHWATEREEEAYAYITFLEIYIRKRRL